MTKPSPMMAQWFACKEASKGAVLLFRCGDFYEAFYEDAELLSRELDLTLTKRQEIPMAGVPVHTAETYIDRLIGRGFRVAIAEQTEDAKEAKGLVRREVVRVVTPGTVMQSGLLTDQSHNFFACLGSRGGAFGLAFIDITTSSFYAVELSDRQQVLSELYAIQPAEILVSHRFAESEKDLLEEIKREVNYLLNTWDDWHFDPALTERFLLQHYKVGTLDGFGLKEKERAIIVAGALLQFLQDHLSVSIDSFRSLHTYSPSEYMVLDPITQRNLELTQSLHDRSRKNTLLAVLDHTHTPMGARKLKRWVQQPLLDLRVIRARQEAIGEFVENQTMRKLLDGSLPLVRDIERLITRVSTGQATPRDLVALRTSLEPVERIRETLHADQVSLIQWALQSIRPFPEVTEQIAATLVDAPPLKMSEGKIIRQGFHAELDELRQLKEDSQTWLERYQERLREELGIRTLRVGYNRMFGYYIEVSKGQAERMPPSFHRRQTLTNAERFLSPELKEFEQKVLSAEERVLSLEHELFRQLREEIARYAPPILQLAEALSEIDALLSLGHAAVRYRYICPTVCQDDSLQIVQGRHPVVEASASHGPFVANDTTLDAKERVMILTGPNMAGKSTYIRQVALITILAQMGSFVPATRAEIGLVDRVFTRIGASDDLARGQSTFMVEMAETANILHHASDRSLVVLDEIGRGTSTYDGISIAWSVAEYLLTTDGKRAKTLFATHYGEMTELEEKIEGAVNYRVAVRETENEVLFLRQIIRGGSDRSYGIHVARLAGLPEQVLLRAQEILFELERERETTRLRVPGLTTTKTKTRKTSGPTREIQLQLFS